MVQGLPDHRDGNARTAYGGGDLFLIRPDNYIGLATGRTDPAPEYLRRHAMPA